MTNEDHLAQTWSIIVKWAHIDMEHDSDMRRYLPTLEHNRGGEGERSVLEYLSKDTWPEPIHAILVEFCRVYNVRNIGWV